MLLRLRSDGRSMLARPASRSNLEATRGQAVFWRLVAYGLHSAGIKGAARQESFFIRRNTAQRTQSSTMGWVFVLRRGRCAH